MSRAKAEENRLTGLHDLFCDLKCLGLKYLGSELGVCSILGPSIIPQRRFKSGDALLFLHSGFCAYLSLFS